MKNTPEKSNSLFNRIVSILEEARSNVVRSVNSNMVVAYWLIGREIVQELQGGDKRADYGRQVIEDLSNRLTKRYRKGFSTTNLWYFRQFYQAYPNRLSIIHPGGGECAKAEKLHPAGGELVAKQKGPPSGYELRSGFSPQLSWSHYRAMKRLPDIQYSMSENRFLRQNTCSICQVKRN